MKICTLTLLLVFTSVHCFTQTRQEMENLKNEALTWKDDFNENSRLIESFTRQLALANQDTDRALIMAEYGFYYNLSDADSALSYAQRALTLSERIHFLRGEARALHVLGIVYRILGDDSKSLEMLYKGLQIAEDNHYPFELARCLNSIGILYTGFEDYSSSISYLLNSYKIDETIHNSALGIFQLTNIVASYISNNQLDSASNYIAKAYTKFKLLQLEGNPFPYPMEEIQALLVSTGQIQFRLGNHPIAFAYMRKANEIGQTNKYHRTLSSSYYLTADFFRQENQTDSCIYYAKKGLDEAYKMKSPGLISVNSNLLAAQYQSKDIKEALYYFKIAKSADDELYSVKQIMSLQKTVSDEQDRQHKIETQKIAYQNKVRQYSLAAGLGVFFLIAFILYRNNRQKQKANQLLLRQKEEIDLQRDKAEKALNSLNATQTQLIQSEKMASLGELTAGIAHEIQNPLNFVNNFSEVNKELIGEMKQEIAKGNLEAVKSIAGDIEVNEDKIIHHGKRADAIVKSMLQHSRTSVGQKELTDMNELADEYLRLSYQGLRARDNSFNATVKTDFDRSIGKMNITPQDIGRVLLNLYNNAFYALIEKRKLQGESFEPVILVRTKKVIGKVEIRVKDNGNGISPKVLEKVFQPFFTTKPAGQGTGLGLSLSYDIIKAHAGEIKVETKEGEGAEFVIQIPIS
jgi:two-component system, NtrC family, sensor kinase